MKMRLFVSVLIIAAGLIVGIPFHAAEAIVPARSDFSIVSPAPGEVITGSTVQVTVALPTGLHLHGFGNSHQEGEGHLHLWLDTLPEHDTATSVVLTEKPEYRFEHVSSGLHTLHVALFRNDETPYNEYVASVDFETAGGQGIDNGTTTQVPPPSRAWRALLALRKTSFGLLALVVLLGGAIAWFTLRKPKA